MSTELDPSAEQEKSEEQKKNDRVAAMNRGRERKRRATALEEANLPFTEDWLEKNLDEMEKDEFDKYLQGLIKENSEEPPKGEEEVEQPKEEKKTGDEGKVNPGPETVKSAREIELEQKLADMQRKFEAQEKNSLTQDDVNAIIEKKMLELNLKKDDEVSSKQNLQILQNMTDAIEQITQSNNDGRVILQPVMRHEIDQDDVLEEPVFFFAFTQSYAIWGDVKKGQAILNPNRRPIKFEHEFRTVRQGAGREKEVIAISKARIISKKEAEYLRKHSEFGIRFFEQLGEATTADARMAEIMTQVANSIGNLNQHQIVEKCRLMDPPIPMSPDVNEMKRTLIQRLAQDQMRNIQAQKNRIRDIHPTATQEQDGKVGTAEAASTV